MVAALVAALVGGFVGVILTFAFMRIVRQRHRRELAELAYIKASNEQAKSSASWKSISSQQSIAPPTSRKPRRQISEPILLKNFEGKRISLPSHMSEMLGMHSKQACRRSSPLLLSPRTSFRDIPSGPGLDESSGSQSQNDAKVPMLLRQPRRKSVSALQRGHGSLYSAVSAESVYSEASVSSHLHHTLLNSIENSVEPTTAPSARDEENIDLVSIRKTGSRGSYYWTLDPSTITRVNASVGAFNQVRHPIMSTRTFL